MTFMHFLASERGAVTTDWVVLTAGVVGLGLATILLVSGGVESLSFDVANELAVIDPTDHDFSHGVTTPDPDADPDLVVTQ